MKRKIDYGWLFVIAISALFIMFCFVTFLEDPNKINRIAGLIFSIMVFIGIFIPAMYAFIISFFVKVKDERRDEKYE